MKIGILTFPKAINYGTALQAAALSKVLSDKGHEVFFIEHKSAAIEKDNSIFDFQAARNPKYAIAHILNLDIALKRKNNFADFQKKYMRFSTEPIAEYDAIVAGSDQIWNYNLTGEDYKTYFLNFNKVNALKVAYAGSFGLSSIDETKRDTIAKLLADFDYLSVREKSAAEIINSLIESEPIVVLDPTLLLSKDDWKQFSVKKNTGDYIFVYTVFNDEKLWNFAYLMSRSTGLPIKTISYSRLHRHNAEIDFTAGPSQWLDCILNASVVITNSFHGMAFSVNFHKEFYFNVPDNGKSVGSRLLDLSARYGVSARNLSLNEQQNNIDWTTVDKLLKKDKERSLAFIDKFTSVE